MCPFVTLWHCSTNLKQKLKSMNGFWRDAAMNALIRWLLEDTDMDGMEQLKCV